MDLDSSSRERLVYRIAGGLADSHEVDASTLGHALVGLREAIILADRHINGKRTNVTVNAVASFRAGSFEFDLHVVQHLAEQARDVGLALLPVVMPKSLPEILAILGLVKFKASEDPAALVEAVVEPGKEILSNMLDVLQKVAGRTVLETKPENSRVVEIHVGTVKTGNVDGNNNVVANNITNIYITPEVAELMAISAIAKGLTSAVPKVLKEASATSVDVVGSDLETKRVFTAENSLAVQPVELGPTEPDGETFIATLDVRTVSLSGEPNGWRFSQVGTKKEFQAKVEDEVYLRSVEQGHQSFQNGDRITARIRIMKKGNRSLHAITEVLRIEPNHRAEQLDLLR